MKNRADESQEKSPRSFDRLEASGYNETKTNSLAYLEVKLSFPENLVLWKSKFLKS